MKYWARSVPPLLMEKGFFNTQSEIATWLVELHHISKRKFELEEKKFFPVVSGKKLQEECVTVIGIEESHVETNTFLKEDFKYTHQSKGDENE